MGSGQGSKYVLNFHCRVKHQAADPYTSAEHELLDRTILTAAWLLQNRTGRRLPVERYQLYPQQNK